MFHFPSRHRVYSTHTSKTRGNRSLGLGWGLVWAWAGPGPGLGRLGVILIVSPTQAKRRGNITAPSLLWTSHVLFPIATLYLLYIYKQNEGEHNGAASLLWTSHVLISIATLFLPYIYKQNKGEHNGAEF